MNEKEKDNKNINKNRTNEYLIPFYSDKNKFEIPAQININKDDSDYITKSIEAINYELNNKSHFSCCFLFQEFFVIIFGLALFVLTLYFSIIFSAFVLFNPMIIIAIILFIISGLISKLVHVFFSIIAKAQVKKMKNKINELNTINNNKKYFWKLGRDYSWVTIKINKKQKIKKRNTIF